MTALLLSARRLPDGRIILVGKDGKELPMQVVPKESSRQMVEVGDEGIGENFGAAGVYEIMLSAASVDVSEAIVELPPRRPKHASDLIQIGNKQWNAYHDALAERIGK